MASIIVRKYDYEENFTDKVLFSAETKKAEEKFSACCDYVDKLRKEHELGNIRVNAEEEIAISDSVKKTLRGYFTHKKSFDILLMDGIKEIKRRVFFA